MPRAVDEVGCERLVSVLDPAAEEEVPDNDVKCLVDSEAASASGNRAMCGACGGFSTINLLVLCLGLTLTRTRWHPTDPSGPGSVAMTTCGGPNEVAQPSPAVTTCGGPNPARKGVGPDDRYDAVFQ